MIRLQTSCTIYYMYKTTLYKLSKELKISDGGNDDKGPLIICSHYWSIMDIFQKINKVLVNQVVAKSCQKCDSVVISKFQNLQTFYFSGNTVDWWWEQMIRPLIENIYKLADCSALQRICTALLASDYYRHKIHLYFA